MNVYLVRTWGSRQIQGVYLDESAADDHASMSEDGLFVDVWPITEPFTDDGV